MKQKREVFMAYVYLAAAIVFEILGTVAMKYSDGFSRPIPSVLIFLFHGICFVFLAMALKTLPIGTTYALWAGVGTAIMAVIGMLAFDESWPMQKILATGLIIVGVVILKMSDSDEEVGTQEIASQSLEIEAKRVAGQAGPLVSGAPAGEAPVQAILSRPRSEL